MKNTKHFLTPYDAKGTEDQEHSQFSDTHVTPKSQEPINRCRGNWRGKQATEEKAAYWFNDTDY